MKLGHVNVTEMLRGISVKQFDEWRAFSELEPFDETRADLRAASIVSALANINRNTKKHPEPFAISDFVLLFGDSTPPPKPQRSAEELERAFVKQAAAYNRRQIAAEKAAERAAERAKSVGGGITAAARRQLRRQKTGS